MRIVSRNPYTGQVLEEFEALGFADSVPEVQKSRRAFSTWRKASVQEGADTSRPLPGVSGSSREPSRRRSPLKWGNPSANQWRKSENAPGCSIILRRIPRDLSKKRWLRPMP